MLANKSGALSEKGNEFFEEIEKAVRPIVDRMVAEDASRLEIEFILKLAVDDVALDLCWMIPLEEDGE